MMTALLLALAVTGQTDYNLIVQEAPTPKTAVHTSKGTYDDEKISALADARAKVRAYTKALADARAEVSSLTQVVAAEAKPRARIQYYSDESPPVLRETAPVVYEEAPVIRSAPIIRTVPRVRSATYPTASPGTYAAATPVTGESCYSSAYSSSAAPSVYSTPMVSAPVTYSVATPIIQAAPVTYSAALPIVAATPVAAFESGVTVARERTRVGLFGRVRQDRRSTTYGSSPVTFGAAPMTFAGATVCVGGT